MGGQLLHTVQSFKYFNEIRPKCINLTSTTIQKIMRKNRKNAKNAKNMGKNIAIKNSGKKQKKYRENNSENPPLKLRKNRKK